MSINCLKELSERIHKTDLIVPVFNFHSSKNGDKMLILIYNQAVKCSIDNN